jgi:hypothetical protein
MTQQYLAGELSQILGDVQAAAATEVCARRAWDLRLEAETKPVTALPSVAARALALTDSDLRLGDLRFRGFREILGRVDDDVSTLANPEIVNEIRHHVQAEKVARGEVPRKLTPEEAEEIKAFGQAE